MIYSPGLRCFGFRLSGICFALLLLLLNACSPVARNSTLAESALPQPRLVIYIAPETPVFTNTQKVLLAPLRLSLHEAEDWGLAMTKLLQDIFLQHRVFSVTERVPQSNGSEDQMLDNAANRGFDYLMVGEVRPPVCPVGNSTGWVGLNIRIISAKNRSTIWHIYGEAYLYPEQRRHYLFYERPYRPAPSLAQGLEAVATAMANVIRLQPTGSEVQRFTANLNL